jgi:hypothetical protein
VFPHCRALAASFFAVAISPASIRRQAAPNDSTWKRIASKPSGQRARSIAIRNGLHHVGNVRDPARQAMLCPTCGARAIERDGYTITRYALDASGACKSCGTRMAGVFAAEPGAWGRCRSTSSATRREAEGDLSQRLEHLIVGAGGNAEHAAEGLAELENEEQRAADREGAETERGQRGGVDA